MSKVQVRQIPLQDLISDRITMERLVLTIRQVRSTRPLNVDIGVRVPASLEMRVAFCTMVLVLLLCQVQEAWCRQVVAVVRV